MVGAVTAIADRLNPLRRVRVIVAFAAMESAITAKVVRHAPRTADSVATDAAVLMRVFTRAPRTAALRADAATAFARRTKIIKSVRSIAPIRRPTVAMATAGLANMPCPAQWIVRTAATGIARARRLSSVA